MLVGEQPGDEEDLKGRPFVGPAGRLLRSALEHAGIDDGRRSTSPTRSSISASSCAASGGSTRRRRSAKSRRATSGSSRSSPQSSRRVIVALGATALGAVMGRRITITDARATAALRNAEGVRVVATYHPSAVLRAPDEDRRQELYDFLVADLRRAAKTARLTRTTHATTQAGTTPTTRSRRSPSAATCSAGRSTSRRRSRCSTRSSRRLQPHRHRGLVLALGRRAQGRRVGDDHRPLDRAGAAATTTSSSRPRSAPTWASATSACKRDYIMRAAEESLRRLSVDAHRPLPVALGRRHHAVRGDARGVFAPDAAGQGEGDRRVESRRRAPRASAGGEPASTGCRATRRCSRTTTCTSARASKVRCRTCACARTSASSRTSRSPPGFLTGKYRSEHGLRTRASAGRGMQEVPESARPRDPRRARRRVAARLRATPAQVALAWLMTRPAVTAPIASATISRSSTRSWPRRASCSTTRRCARSTRASAYIG